VNLHNDCIGKGVLKGSNLRGSGFGGGEGAIELRAAIRDCIANFGAVDSAEKMVNGGHCSPSLSNGVQRVLNLSEFSLVNSRIHKCKSELKFSFKELD